MTYTRQTRDRRGGHKTTPLASQPATVRFTTEQRDFIKRQGRRAQRRESKIKLADAKQQYWDELELQDVYLYDEDFEWEDWELKFIDSLFGI